MKVYVDFQQLANYSSSSLMANTSKNTVTSLLVVQRFVIVFLTS